jgi:3-isopropylmalate/(R)-2-methylmalate dehydratase small subunit
MEQVRRVEGIVAPIPGADIDTDQIIPKQFLKRIERTGYGQFLFYDWRFDENGSPRKDFPLDQPAYRGARVLVSGPNFGCGSSREHAAWSIKDWGFGAVIAPGFADIFRSNCFQNGLIPVELPADRVAELMARASRADGYSLAVDLEARTVSDDEGLLVDFEIDPFRRECLLNGWDDIGLTLRWEDEITAFERSRGD